MSSLDVDSLFTNIPLKETVKICSNLLFRDSPIVDGLNKDEFEKLLTLATTESFILFDGSYYQQTDGVAMGSPLGPTLANVFLCYHEQQWLYDCPTAFKPIYYKRYVDDIFVLLPESSCLPSFKEYLNNKHPNMNFTSEEETENQLPFLDVFVKRVQSNFITSVYRKPTFSGVYTHYTSYLPDVYKESLVSTLLYRAYRICTNWNEIHKETIQIKQIMTKNGYPENLLDKLISSFYRKMCTETSKAAEDDSENSIQLVLPFLGNHTKRMEKKIKKILNETIPSLNVRFVYRTSTRLSALFRFKDRIPKYLSAGVVYKFTCGGCNSSYIGETIRHSKRRLSEHLGRSALTGKALSSPPVTAISQHVKTCRTEPKEDDFTILGSERNEELLKIKESLFIHRDKPSINIQGQSVKLILFK